MKMKKSSKEVGSEVGSDGVSEIEHKLCQNISELKKAAKVHCFLYSMFFLYFRMMQIQLIPRAQMPNQNKHQLALPQTTKGNQQSVNQ